MSRAQREAFVAGMNWADTHPINTDKGTEPLRRYPDSTCTNVREIVVEWLKDNGYDGLCHSATDKDRGCECKLPGIFPYRYCAYGDCRPGVLVDGKIVERE